MHGMFLDFWVLDELGSVGTRSSWFSKCTA